MYIILKMSYIHVYWRERKKQYVRPSVSHSQHAVPGHENLLRTCHTCISCTACLTVDLMVTPEGCMKSMKLLIVHR